MGEVGGGDQEEGQGVEATPRDTTEEAINRHVPCHVMYLPESMQL